MDTSLIDKLTPFGGAYAWVTHVLLILLVALLADFTQKRALRRLKTRLIKTASPWDDAVAEAVTGPLSTLLWVLGISFALQIAGQHYNSAVVEYIAPLRIVVVIACIAWFLWRLTKRAEVNVIAQRRALGQAVDAATVYSVGKLTRVSIGIIAALVVLQNLGFSVSGVLAFGGMGGIVVGFAAKDLLANFFGGLMIYLDRPFVVGDKIRSPERDMEGTVEDIGWRLTCIRTMERRPLYVPNSVFTTIAIENISRMSHRRIHETIGLRYEDIAKVAAIVAEIKAMLVQLSYVDTAEPVTVSFSQYGASALNIIIDVCVIDKSHEGYHELKQEILLKVYHIVASHRADFAFPTSTLHIPQAIRVQQADNIKSVIS